MDLLPKVFRTEGDLTNFDSSRIFNSILKETGLSEEKAKFITELVVRRIISSGIKFLSGPHIREIVCSILSEQHYEDERKLYTRIGIPLMDYEQILEKGLAEFPKMKINPELIYNWTSSRISEEYTHLRILTAEESKAHLYGDIHIHQLRYYDLKPITQIWDPRLIIENGIPPFSNYISCCALKPATNLKSALDHLTKWLLLTQNEICGSQGYENITTFLAPFVKELKEQELNQLTRNFIYEINYISVLKSQLNSPTTITIAPSVINIFGKIDNSYENSYEECLRLFDSFYNNFRRGDNNKNPFITPEHIIYINKPFLDEFTDSYYKVWEEISTMVNPIFTNLNNHFSDNKSSKNESLSSYHNQGIIQEVCINLPRIAYLTKDEESFLSSLRDKFLLISKILMKKYDIIRRRLASNYLPILAGVNKEFGIFLLEDQYLSISFIGLNEAIKFLTDYELHEHPDSFNLGKKSLIEMNKICEDLSLNNKANFVLGENISEISPFRFAKLDLQHFPKETIQQFSKKDHFYTNSAHFRKDAEISVIERVKLQEEYHQYIKNGAIEPISLNSLRKSNLDLRDFIKNVFLPSKLARVKFYS